MAEPSFPALATSAPSAWADLSRSNLLAPLDTAKRRAITHRPLPSYTQRLLRQLRLKLATASPSPETLDLSAVICTYNGEQRLPQVLACLLAQLGTEHLAWEVIVVDNNSTDDTAQVVKTYQQQWPQDIPLRYAFEPRQGAAYARQHAIQIARSPLVGFLDDDNHPALGWVLAAHRFGQAHPQAGAFGSRIRGDFETSPPPNFDRIGAMLALTERGPKPLIYDPRQKILPPAAGLVVRRQAWLNSVPARLSLADAIGFRAAGEDLEVVLHMQRHGWEIWYNPAMRMQHQIPASRFERDYLLRLFRGIGLSRHHTRMLSVARWLGPLMTLLYMANDLRKIVRHLLRYRGEAIADTVAACELTLYVYSLLSPFYMVGRRQRQRVAQPGDVPC